MCFIIKETCALNQSYVVALVAVDVVVALSLDYVKLKLLPITMGLHALQLCIVSVCTSV